MLRDDGVTFRIERDHYTSLVRSLGSLGVSHAPLQTVLSQLSQWLVAVSFAQIQGDAIAGRRVPPELCWQNG